jgi:hypothetical protein
MDLIRRGENKMTVKQMIKLFDKFGEEGDVDFFEKLEHPIKMEFKRRDLCAFVKLNEIVDCDDDYDDIVSAADHDQIWLGVELEDLAKVITAADIQFLSACGVFISDYSLSMFV